MLSCCVEVGDIRAEAAFVLRRNERDKHTGIKVMAGGHRTEGASLTTKDGLGVPWHWLTMSFGAYRMQEQLPSVLITLQCLPQD